MKRLGIRRSVVMVAAAVVAVLVFAEIAAACPTCKEALAANDPSHQRMVAGYFYSILFMMSMPFLLLGGFSAYMYLEIRRARARGEWPAAADAGS